MNSRPVAHYFESRAGLSSAWRRFVNLRCPKQLRLRYVTTSMIVFGFFVEAVTGVFLWSAYSPSAQTAWESVYYIQHEMFLGWLVRGIHHYMTDVLIVVMILDFFVLIVTGAYRPPRELRYWLTLLSMFVLVAIALSGYLLVWDQQNYWSSNVRTHLMTLAPGGEDLQAIVVGGAEYGHHTLTRFFAVHAGILPVLYVALTALRGWLSYKQDATPRSETHIHEATAYYWPWEPLKALAGGLVMLGLAIALTVHFDASVLADPMEKGPFVGADLKPPADPSLQYPAARPEWYFLYLFQLLKFFPGESEFIGAIVIPTLVTAFVMLAPIWGRWKIGHWINIAGFAVLGLGMVLLSRMALLDDATNEDYQVAVEKADADALRMHDLIQRRVALEEGGLSAPGMISREGAAVLLRRDPLVQGPELFKKHCANCHTYDAPGGAESGEPTFARRFGLGFDGKPDQPPPPGAPNLYRFASREWIRGLLDPDLIAKEEYEEYVVPGDDEIESEILVLSQADAPYFGSTAHKTGRMATWVQQHIAPVGAEVDTDVPMLLDEQVEAIAAALSAEAGLAYQHDADEADAAKIEEGRRLIKSTCATHCHKFHDAGHAGLGPDLTGYGSYEWTVGLIADPSHPRFYGSGNDRMPAFAPDLDEPHKNALRWDEIATIVDWLRRDYYRPEDERPVDSSSPQLAAAAATTALSSIEPLPRIEDFADETAGKIARAEALFERNCSACHAFTDEAGQGIAASEVSAPNLFGFASREWLADFLDPEKMKSARFFGKTSHVAGDMVDFSESNFVDMDEETKAAYDAVVVALSAEAKLSSQAELDAEAEGAGTIEEGRTAIVDTFACIDCHKFGDDGDVGTGAPDLTGYGSLDWLKRFVANPSAEENYGDGNDRMPAFRREDHPDLSLLSESDLELLLRWMRGELAPPKAETPAPVEPAAE